MSRRIRCNQKCLPRCGTPKARVRSLDANIHGEIIEVRSVFATLRERHPLIAYLKRGRAEIEKKIKTVYHDTKHWFAKRFDGDYPDSATWPSLPSARTIRAWQRFYAKQSEGNLAQKAYMATDGGKAGGTTSLFVDLTTTPGQHRFYTGQL
jgi:hypothetical protein